MYAYIYTSTCISIYMYVTYNPTAIQNMNSTRDAYMYTNTKFNFFYSWVNKDLNIILNADKVIDRGH